jgi:hypothetical protein
MDGNCEVIALVLDERKGRRHEAENVCEGAQRLVRRSDGRVSLEDIETREEFDRTARITGCFRRGKAIRDPSTRQIIGYEMEEFSPLRAALRA